MKKEQLLNLNRIDDLEKEIEKQYEDKHKDIENILLEDYEREEISITDCTFSKTKFINTKIINSNLDYNTFIDTTFENCDFSNTSFEKGTFIRCEFKNCKMIGCSLWESKLNNVKFYESNLNYINYTSSIIENTEYKNTGIISGTFQEVKFNNNVSFLECNLTAGTFYDTSLKDIDFSTDIIEGIVTSIKDLKGVKINQFQAVDLMGILGVKVI